MSKNEFICDCNIIHQDIVNDTLNKMGDEDLLNKLAEFFKILGDTTRTKILYALDKNQMCVCDIANVLNMWNRSFILKKTYKISFEKFNIMYKNLIDIDVRMKSWALIWSEEDDILYEIEKAILTSNF